MRHVFALAVVLAALAMGAPASAGVPDARDVPLVDQLGRTFTLREIGRPAAVVFVDADCDDACAIAEGLFAKLSQSLAKSRLDARLLTVTLDPERDSPIVMSTLARRFSADPQQWRWASGKPANVKRLMGAFQVFRVDQKVHSTFAYVLDAHGIPVRTIPLSTIADRELFTLLKSLARA